MMELRTDKIAELAVAADGVTRAIKSAADATAELAAALGLTNRRAKRQRGKMRRRARFARVEATS